LQGIARFQSVALNVQLCQPRQIET
jgi:hypothetical protein